MTSPGERPAAPPFRPLLPPPAPSSYRGRIVTGVVLAIIAASVLAVGITEMLSGKVDAGSVGAVVFLAGLTALGVGLSISGLRAQSEARQAIAHALEHQLLELAARQGGSLTIPLVSLHLSVPLERARAMLDALAVRGGAEVRVADDATLLYEVPGLGPRPLGAGSPRLRAAEVGLPSAAPDRPLDEVEAEAADELFASPRKHSAGRQG